MRKYTYDWFLNDVKNGRFFTFRYQDHEYSIENNYVKGKRISLYLARDKRRVSDDYQDPIDFLNAVRIGGKSFRELFREEEEGKIGFRMISKI